MRKNKKLLSTFYIAVILLFGICLGNISSTTAKAAKADDEYSTLGVLVDVLHYIETNYVDQVSREELIYGAIKGMLDILDPHTIFMPPDVYQEMKVDDPGFIEGLGLIVESRDNRLVVKSSIKGSPAYAASIKAGDIIVAISTHNCHGISISAATRLMRGVAGSKVSLKVKRLGGVKSEKINLVRERIEIPYVDYKLLASGYGYVRIKSFKDGTKQKMVAAIQKMELQSGDALNGLVLDLRNNPGGLFSEAIKVVDEFVTKGVIVSTDGKNKTHVEEQLAGKGGSFLKGNMVVLINKKSASSSEIVCAALHDLKRALVIGTKSFGKGSVQSIIDLDDGSGLKLTVARYFTPNMRKIDFVGISPDVQVQLKVSDNKVSGEHTKSTDAVGHKLLALFDSPESISQNDYQLQAAYSYLKLGKLPE